ncbi:MAG: glycosyltransferase family 4 protein [Chloroflexi bacterium]|nr:glycosyltransferase family 4 protein [Chloroflexota bacterium]
MEVRETSLPSPKDDEVLVSTICSAIGTTAGAAGEIIEHGKTGYLIEPNDSTTLANHISHLASDRDLLTELSFNARKRYAQQPSWDETASQIRNFLLDMK